MGSKTGTRWPRSLRLRLTLWYTGVLAVILAGAALLVCLGARHALRAEADGFLASEARQIASAAGGPGDAPDPSDIAEAVAASSPGASPAHRPPELLPFDIVYTRLVRDGGGDALATSPDLSRQSALLASLDALLRGPLPPEGRYDFAGPDEERTMRVLSAPLRVGTRPAVLQVAVPWDGSADLLERLGALLLLGVPAVLLLAALGGWALIGRTLQPISRIVTEAERLDAASPPRGLLPEATETDSEIGHLVATLNRMTTRLHEAFEVQRRAAEAQRRFAADASHELRTPLTILRGEMELALSRPRPPETYQATLTSAVEEVAHLSRIVEGLGFLARRDAGMMPAVAWGAADVDLSALGRSVVAEFSAVAEAKHIRLHLEAPGRPCAVRGDADQLLQLLRNLVDNALKYTPAGGQVTVGVAGDDAGAAVVTVQDTGIGIAPADLPRVFDRFWRADRSRAGDGSGLGLAICAEIAAAHGGRLEVTSDAGRGSCFRLHLPADKSPALEVPG